MAMDVHIPHAADHDAAEHHQPVLADSFMVDSFAVDSEQAELCTESTGHCSHHQAHTLALVCTRTLSSQASHPVFLSHYKVAVFIYTQAPPRRPPKA
jgi:hypothetical protein